MDPVRIIPCLDVKDGRVVKGVRFVDLRDAGDPVGNAVHYQQEGADELACSISPPPWRIAGPEWSGPGRWPRYCTSVAGGRRGQPYGTWRFCSPWVVQGVGQYCGIGEATTHSRSSRCFGSGRVVVAIDGVGTPICPPA